MTGRVCCDCSAVVSVQNKTGRCRPCALRHQNADPEFQARRKARLAIVVADPVAKARHRAGCKRAGAARKADPVMVEVMRENGRRYGAPNLRCVTPEQRAVAGKTKQARELAWCPREHWGLNQKLKRGGYLLPERKAMIADVVRKEERARLAAMTGLERQMERLANGAKLVAKFEPRRAEHAFTLGGVSGGML